MNYSNTIFQSVPLTLGSFGRRLKHATPKVKLETSTNGEAVLEYMTIISDPNHCYLPRLKKWIVLVFSTFLFSQEYERTRLVTPRVTKWQLCLTEHVFNSCPACIWILLAEHQSPLQICSDTVLPNLFRANVFKWVSFQESNITKKFNGTGFTDCFQRKLEWLFAEIVIVYFSCTIPVKSRQQKKFIRVE